MERETKIVNGAAKKVELQGSWRIRGVARELKVSPVPGQLEMVIARPANDTPLKPGRYALVINRTGYDFTVKGKPSAEFCIEGFETGAGTIFTPCPVK